MPPRTIGPSQASRIAASAAQPFPGCGGESTRWVHPASRARMSSARSGPSPSGQSRPNHREPVGAAAATLSTDCARMRRVDVRELQGRGRPGGRGLAVGVRQGLAPDRAEDDRGRHRDAEHSRAEVALVAVDEHPRDDPPRSQRPRVRAHGGGAARPGEQMPARGLGQHLRRGGLEVGQVRGEDRLDVRGHPAEVDLGLVAAVRGGRADRGRRRGQRGPERRTARGERGRREDGRGGGRAGHLEELTTSALGHVWAPLQRARVREERERVR